MSGQRESLKANASFALDIPVDGKMARSSSTMGDEEPLDQSNKGQVRHHQVRNSALIEAAKRAADFEEKSIKLASSFGEKFKQAGWDEKNQLSLTDRHDRSIHFHMDVYGVDKEAVAPTQIKLEDLDNMFKSGLSEQDLISEAKKQDANGESYNSKTVLPAVMKALAEKKERIAEKERADDDNLVKFHLAEPQAGGHARGNSAHPGTELTSISTSNASATSTNGVSLEKKEQGTGGESAAEAAAAAAVKADKNPNENEELTEIPEDLLGFSVRDGLSDAALEDKRLKYGFNEIVEKKRNPFLKFLGYFTGSIAYLIEAAMILSAVLGDWTDFGIILALLIVNALIGFIEEAKAESAVDALRSTLALQCKTVRNKVFQDVPSRELVPGDIISLRLGDIIPADCKLLGVNANFEKTHNGELLIDQSALTGESLAVSKRFNDLAYSGTIVKQGQMLALVVATGEKTFLGRAAHLISITNESGHFQKVIEKIGNFLVLITLTMVIIILVVGVTAQHNSFLDQLDYALVVTIASIPVGLPTVLSVTMAVGAKQLAAKRVIVKRLTAVEEMAGVDILCSDKTGTLTLNQLTLDRPHLSGSFTEADLLFYSFLSSESATNDAIESCIRKTAIEKVPLLQEASKDNPEGGDKMLQQIGYRVLQFQPFDPTSKMTRATVLDVKNQKVFCVAKGAPQVILKMSDKETHDSIMAAEVSIVNFARGGLRALGVSRSGDITFAEHEAGGQRLSWHLIGLLSLLDPPRPDSQQTIESCKSYGISVKMVTGDSILIAKEVARRLGMQRTILSPDKLTDTTKTEAEITHHVERADGFAQVVPEDKFRVVELLQKRNHLVAMTGDGVNDAPALKKANVGIAVHGCTDAARSAADIVLLEPGLSAIVDGIMSSRQIFQRMRSYAVYRITSTVHFLIFLFCTIMAWEWNLPATLVVLIALLNDGATLVISVDNALISHKPDKWRIGQLLTLSIVLGLLLTGSSFAHFLISKYYFNHSTEFTQTVLYLQMSSCPHFVIFSTRLAEPFYKNPPSFIFFIAVFGTQIFAMFISIYGVLAPEAIGWPWGIAIMAISLGYFALMDQVKVLVYKYWSFELTATLWPSKERRDKLKLRKEEALRMERVEITVQKVRRIIKFIECATKFKHYKPLPEAKLVLPKGKHH